MTPPRDLTRIIVPALAVMMLVGCSEESDTPPGADVGADITTGPDAAARDIAADLTPDAPKGPTSIEYGPGTSGTLAAEGSVAVSGAAAKALEGAAVAAPKGATSTKVTIAGAADIVPSDYLALGPTVAFTPARQGQPVDLRYTLPFRPARMPAGAGSGSLVVFVKRSGKVSLLPLLNPQVDLTQGRLAFSLDELGMFQAAIHKKAGSSVTRRYAYRSIVGFSMGGGASAILGLKHPEKFDFLGPLGGEPNGNLLYFLSMLEDGFLAGFCTADDAKKNPANKIGTLCPLKRSGLPRQHEIMMSYEKQLYQQGQGVGLTLGRSLYMRGLRDILRAYGNPMFYNPDHPYLPPGVPASHLSEGSTVCGKPHKLTKFYDREYNPDGSLPVITFCDGSDSSKLGRGVFDPAIRQTRPTQVFLAVDVNDNGKRDSGEPLVVHAREPYQDVGSDGKADAAETGYDAKTNPDPAGDNYHYLRNPSGSEGNFRWDTGEPYEDVGIDGVKGTCQAATGTSGCYDYGEGNKKYDYSPGVQRWMANDPWQLWAKLTEAQRARLDIWSDAGIRDFLNAHVASNSFAGRLAEKGQPIRIYENFVKLPATSTMKAFDFGKVDWLQTGKHAYVRYGDPDMPQSQVEKTGDGRHVGTALQIVNRTLSFFAMIQKRWPNGDRELKNADVTSTNFKKNQTFTSTSTGQQRPYAVFVPPGYYHAANTNKRYPVVYFLHGYGQSPDDLIALSSLFANYMVGRTIKESARFQKFIIVYVDGRCRPGGSTPLPSTGDRCERGTFYIDTPIKGSTAKMEALMWELMDHIDKTYRTKKAEDVSVKFY